MPTGVALHRCPSRCCASAAAAPAAPPASPAAPPPLTWRASFDFKALRESLPAARANVALRGAAADPDAVVALYEAFAALKATTDGVREARNAAAAAVGSRAADAASKAAAIEAGKSLKAELAVLEAQLEAAEGALQREAQRLPNDTHPSVPHGGDESAAVLLTTIGAPRVFDGFSPLDHVALGERLKLFDFDAGARVSGTRFVYLRGAAALLELALIQWAMARAAAAGFEPHTTPDLVKAQVVEKCGFQPRAANTQVYGVAGSELCLTGTAEIPLAGLYADAVIPQAQLPIRLAAFGHCFRTEAGAAGAGTRGLYRLHQFSKVELFVVCAPDQSDAIHDELLAFEASLYSELGLHCRVLDMPACDLGAPAYRKFDVEAWMPGMGRFGEISSASNCTDYQARRLNTRFRPHPTKEEPKPPIQHCHTLNATACAVPRMIIALLETHQREDGSVDVPPALQPFLGGLARITPRDAAGTTHAAASTAST